MPLVLSSAGPATQLQPNRPYKLAVSLVGSVVTVAIDGINILATDLPFTLRRGQPGIWAMGRHNVEVRDFDVQASRGKAFVVMQFTDPYNELFEDVIRPVCEEIDIEAHRADDSYGPGLIIADMAREISESNVVIAEITPSNPNVYYEVGYAHAKGKPTILIAEGPTKLPFDVSPFRVLFYENSIGGKKKVEEGLRKHLKAILSVGLTS